MNNLWEIRQWRIDADGKLYGTMTEEKKNWKWRDKEMRA